MIEGESKASIIVSQPLGPGTVWAVTEVGDYAITLGARSGDDVPLGAPVVFFAEPGTGAPLTAGAAADGPCVTRPPASTLAAGIGG
jgi:hypothetical protein